MNTTQIEFLPLNVASLPQMLFTSLLLCLILVSLGYLWGWVWGQWSRLAHSVRHYSLWSTQQLTVQRKPGESLVCWLCWKVSLGCGKMTHGYDFNVALILNFIEWKHNPVLTRIFQPGLGLPLSQWCVTFSLPETHILNTSPHGAGEKLFVRGVGIWWI